MAQMIRDVMTPNPSFVPPSATLRDAAMVMRDQQVGDVLVCDGDRLVGIVTDRDLVIRGLAEAADAKVPIGELCTTRPLTVRSDTSVNDAARMMAENAIRRLPVMDDGRLVGVVSLGDLAVEQDPSSVLGEISSAIPDA